MNNSASAKRILSTARRLFFENGFEKVTTDMLAREASVSKATIYRYFENMADIMRQVAAAEAVKFREVDPPKIVTRDDLRQALTQYGYKFLTFLNEPDTLEFSCLVHEEARRNPGIGRSFFVTAFGQTQSDVADLLTSGQEAGILTRDMVPYDIAEDLISLFEGFGMTRAQLGVSERPFEEIDNRVARAVATILKTYG